MSDNQSQVISLFERMKQAGQLSASSQQIIVANLNSSVTASVQGTQAVDIGSEDPIVMLLVLDNSGSMLSNAADVKAGLHKLVKMAQKIFKKYGVEIILGVIVFGEKKNIKPLFPFTLVDKIDPKWIDAYNPTDSETALLDGVFTGLVGSAGYGFSLYEEAIRGGKRVFVGLTDGGENVYAEMTQAYEDACQRNATIMNDLRRPKQSVFGLIGVGPDTWYRPIGLKMGFKDKNIVSISRSENAFAVALEIVSQSMELHSVAQSTGQAVEEEDGDVLTPTNVVTDEDAEEDFFS